MLRTDSKAFRAFERGFTAHMVGRDVYQQNGLHYTYKDKECGCCMGAHMACYWDLHQTEERVPYVETYSQGLVMEQLAEGFRVHDKLFDEYEESDLVAKDFVIENIGEFSPVLKHGDGISGLCEFLGLDDEEFSEFSHLLGELVDQQDPWNIFEWQHHGIKDEATALMMAIRFYERFLEHWLPHMCFLEIRGRDREGVYSGHGRGDVFQWFMADVRGLDFTGVEGRKMPMTRTQIWDNRDKEDWT